MCPYLLACLHYGATFLHGHSVLATFCWHPVARPARWGGLGFCPERAVGVPRNVCSYGTSINGRAVRHTGCNPIHAPCSFGDFFAFDYHDARCLRFLVTICVRSFGFSVGVPPPAGGLGLRDFFPDPFRRLNSGSDSSLNIFFYFFYFSSYFQFFIFRLF